jgi:amidase
VSELHDLDAHGQAALLRLREISAVELIAHHLERIGDSQVNAFITVTPERALAQAAAADRLLASGDAPPFCGVPTAFKDMMLTAGVPTTLGSAALRDVAGEVSAYTVERVEAAGFISLGKTSTPEAGLSAFTDNDLIGPTSTPARLGHNAGGSSGGAAAAVAAGLVPLAPGSDGGGSIRIPASCCGILGFKPSRGLLSLGPVGTDWPGLTTDGTLTRTVRDAAALLEVMARSPEPFAPATQRDPGRLRIARWATPYLPGIAVAPECLAAWDHATGLLAGIGHEIVDLPNPFPAELEPQFNVIWSSLVAAAPIGPDAASALRPTTDYWRRRGRGGSAVELAAAMTFLEQTTRQVLGGLAGFDAFLTPTLALPPQPHGWFTEPTDPAEVHRRELEFTPFTAVYNMAGIPAASLPLYTEESGLPIGSMLAVHRGEDRRLLSLCAQLEGNFTPRAA